MADAKYRQAKLFADGLTRGQAAANPEKGTYEFGTELTEGGSLAAYKNVTYGASGQARSRTRGQQTR